MQRLIDKTSKVFDEVYPPETIGILTWYIGALVAQQTGDKQASLMLDEMRRLILQYMNGDDLNPDTTFNFEV